jgi:hypothetical protein
MMVIQLLRLGHKHDRVLLVEHSLSETAVMLLESPGYTENSCTTLQIERLNHQMCE